METSAKPASPDTAKGVAIARIFELLILSMCVVSDLLPARSSWAYTPALLMKRSQRPKVGGTTMVTRTDFSVDYIFISLDRRRDPAVEQAALAWIAANLGRRFRCGAVGKPGSCGTVTLLAAFPPSQLHGRAAWACAAAALLAADEAELLDTDHLLTKAKLISLGEFPNVHLRNICEQHFFDCWSGRMNLPLGSLRLRPAHPPSDTAV